LGKLRRARIDRKYSARERNATDYSISEDKVKSTLAWIAAAIVLRMWFGPPMNELTSAAYSMLFFLLVVAFCILHKQDAIIKEIKNIKNDDGEEEDLNLFQWFIVVIKESIAAAKNAKKEGAK
jgi:hypothetical protein